MCECVRLECTCACPCENIFLVVIFSQMLAPPSWVADKSFSRQMVKKKEKEKKVSSVPFLTFVGGPCAICFFSITGFLFISAYHFSSLTPSPSFLSLPFSQTSILFTPLYLRFWQSVSDPLTLTEQFVEMPDDFMSLCLWNCQLLSRFCVLASRTSWLQQLVSFIVIVSF